MKSFKSVRWQHIFLLLLTLSFIPGARSQQPYPQDPYDNQQPMDQGDPSQDPPSRVGRLSILQGNVSYQPQGVQDFSAAELNYPLTNGDRLYADASSLAEIQAGQLAVRMGQQTDLTVTELDAQYAQFGLAQGSVHVRAFALDPDSTTELDTPNASIIFTQPGDVRIDVSPDGSTTTVYVLSGQVQVTADGVNQGLSERQGIQITGMGPSSARMVGRPRPDALDSFSSDRDRSYQSYFASEQNYVNADTIGAADLGAYGDWSSDSDYGPVWYPRGVAADWAPYTYGHWVSVAPWGWTWVEYEPWGFAPFHYGRWNRFGNRWGWIPGPPVVRPVYSPALVAFVGGGGISIGAGGVAAWFPLGPREVYRPWYRTSPVYVNRVNVSNIYTRNAADVRRIYGSRTNVYVNVNVNYVNRGIGTVVINSRDFGTRQRVADIRFRGDQARRFANAPVINRPPVAPPARPVAGPPVHAMPAHGAQRPSFDSQNPNRPRPGQRPGQSGGDFGRRPDNRPDNGFNNNQRPGNDGRFNNQPNNNNQPGTAPVVRPGQPASNQPPSNNQPGNYNQPGNNGRDNNGRDNRFDNRPRPDNDPRPNNGAQPSNNGQPPVRNDNNNNRDNYNGRSNDNRFNNNQPGNNPTNNGNYNRPPQNAAPAISTPPQPAPQVTPQSPRVRPDDYRQRPQPNVQPAQPVPNDQQQARPGPQSRPAPDGPVRMNPQPENRPDNNQQRFQRPQPDQPRPQPQAQPQPQRQEQPRPEQPRQEQPRPQPQQQQRQGPPPQARPQQPHPQPPPPKDDHEKK